MSPPFFKINPSLAKRAPKAGFALGAVLVILAALSLVIGAALRYTQQNTRDDAKRLLLLEATSAAKAILAYKAAELYQNNFKDITPGVYHLATPLAHFLEATMPIIDTQACEIIITKASPFRLTTLNPANPANHHTPFIGQTLSERTITIATQVTAKAAGGGPSITIHASLPVYNIALSYFNCGVFFDMEAEYINNNNGLNFSSLSGMAYSNGTIWSTGHINFWSSILNTRGFRQTAPSFIQNALKLHMPSPAACVYDSTGLPGMPLPGSTSPTAWSNYDSNHGATNPEVEASYYDSLHPDWALFKNNASIHIKTTAQPLPINGFRNYVPSNPPAGSSSNKRNSLNYAWALLEPALSKNSQWYKGAGEAYKFCRNACAIIRVMGDPPSLYNPTLGLPALTGACTLCNVTFAGGQGSSVPSNVTCPLPAPTGYTVSLYNFKRTSPHNPKSPITSNSQGNPLLQPFGKIPNGSTDTVLPFFERYKKDALTLNQWDSSANFVSFTPYILQKDGTNLCSFYDPRRKKGIDALVIDVEKLYNLLRKGNAAFLDYQPTTDYNGTVYIWFPESVFNKGGDSTVNPITDNYNIRVENYGQTNATDTTWGVVLINGENIPAKDDPAKGFTLACNVPVYVAGNYGSGYFPCMIAADAVTVLSRSFFDNSKTINKASTPPIVSHYTAPAQHKVPITDYLRLYSSILSGVTSYSLTGDWRGRGDGPLNTPRTIEDWSAEVKNGNSPWLMINGTIFGLFEPQVAVGPVSSCANFTPWVNIAPGHYPPGALTTPWVLNNSGTITPPATLTPGTLAIPPSCAFLSCDTVHQLGSFQFISKDSYDNFKDE